MITLDQLKKNSTFALKSPLKLKSSTLPVGTRFMVSKGGKIPSLSFYHQADREVKSFASKFTASIIPFLEASDFTDCDPELKGWTMPKNKQMTTSRGVAYESTLAFEGKKVVIISNTGCGGADTFEIFDKVKFDELTAIVKSFAPGKHDAEFVMSQLPIYFVQDVHLISFKQHLSDFEFKFNQITS